MENFHTFSQRNIVTFKTREEALEVVGRVILGSQFLGFKKSIAYIQHSSRKRYG